MMVFLILLAVFAYILKKFGFLKSENRLSDLSKRPVLITGCDTGFGYLSSIRLLQLGCPVFSGCLTSEGREKLEAVGREFKGQLWTLHLDVTKQNSVDEAAETIRTCLKRENFKVNNAGIMNGALPDDWLEVQDYQNIIDVNLLGLIRVTQAMKPMIKSVKGRIVNVSSIAGRVAFGYCAPYSVSKYGVQAYSDAIRRELYNFGVSVHVIEPGFFSTQMTSEENVTHQVQHKWDRLSNELKQEYGEQYVQEYIKVCLKGVKNSANPNLKMVVDCYDDALFSTNPKGRYNPGFESNYFVRPLSVFPTYAQDFIIRLLIRVLRIQKPIAQKVKATDIKKQN